MSAFRSVFTRQTLLVADCRIITRKINTNPFPNAKTAKIAEKMFIASPPKNTNSPEFFFQRHIKTVAPALDKKLKMDNVFDALKDILENHKSSYDHSLKCFADFDPKNHFQDSAMIQFRADVDILDGELTFNSSPRFNSILEKDLSDNEQKMIESLFKLAWGKPFTTNLTGTLLIRKLTFDTSFTEYCTGRHRDIDFVTGKCKIMVMEVDSENVDVETTVWTDSGEKTRKGPLITFIENQEHDVTITQKDKDKAAHRTVLVIRLQENMTELSK
tara:strand:+ start:3060 stop:3878 length:819 start_codon:yes stop_codon:yes gene_type:complete